MTPEELVERWRRAAEIADNLGFAEQAETWRIAASDLAAAIAWQPIATAPMDATWVLVGRVDWPRPRIASFRQAQWVDDGGMVVGRPPTHWRPLPTPPSEVTP